MSATVSIISKDGHPYRDRFDEVVEGCPLVEKVDSGHYRLAGGIHGFSVDSADYDTQELYLYLRGAWNEDSVDAFKRLFDWLCEHTTWDLELDWSDVLREDIYRPSQAKAA